MMKLLKEKLNAHDTDQLLILGSSVKIQKENNLKSVLIRKKKYS